MKILGQDIRIEETKDKMQIIRIMKDGKNIYIGSKYNMKQELDNFLKNINNIKNNTILIVLGFGTGEHIKILREHYSENSIFILEPNKSLKKYGESLEWIKQDDNVRIFNLDIQELTKYINEFNVDNINISVFANYSKIYLDELKVFFEELKRYCINIKGNKTTKLLFSKLWFETLINNIPYIGQSIPSNVYKDAYKGKPAIIVSAGPSLEKNVEDLKGYEDNFLIFTGGRTFKGLIEKNIKPDLLAVLDPGDKLYKMVEGYIEKESIPLFFYEGTNPDVVKKHRGTKILSRYSHSYSDFIERVTQMPIIQGSGGGSVAHYMTLHAVFMGCNPVIFIGQDLAYGSDKKYSDFAKIKGESIEEVKSENDVYVEGVTESIVKSDIYLNAFRVEFENIIQRYPQVKFINATEGGARIHGTTEMCLKDALKIYKKDINKDVQPKYKINIEENIRKELADIIIKCRAVKELLQRLLKILASTKNENDEIINMEHKVDQYIQELELLKTLFYPIFYDILSKKNNAFEITGKNIEYSVEERGTIYKSIIEVIDYALPEIEKVLDRLSIK